MSNKYVHGYSEREGERLYDQANILQNLLHKDIRFPENETVLEVGCGTGAQTVYLAKNNPKTKFTAIDISLSSLEKAKKLAKSKNIDNVIFKHTDLFNLPFEEESFDHLFVCFVLEHLNEPMKALLNLYRLLKKGGSITLIEGDHGSCYFHPSTKEAVIVWNCLIQAQKELGGNSLIGRQVYPLLKNADFKNIDVSPVYIYCDENNPKLTDGFVYKIIIPMVEGVKEKAIELGFVDETTWQKGIADLHETGKLPNGIFNYTFFKGKGIKL